MKGWIFLTLLFLLGCSPTLVWDRMGHSEEQFARDKKECEKKTSVASSGRFQSPPRPPSVEYRTADGQSIPQASSGPRSANLGSVFQQQAFEQQFFQQCMEARGYQTVKETSGSK